MIELCELGIELKGRDCDENNKITRLRPHFFFLFISGGADSDILNGEDGDDRIYAEAQIRIIWLRPHFPLKSEAANDTMLLVA